VRSPVLPSSHRPRLCRHAGARKARTGSPLRNPQVESAQRPRINQRSLPGLLLSQEAPTTIVIGPAGQRDGPDEARLEMATDRVVYEIMLAGPVSLVPVQDNSRQGK
jgi:hypothetical protein